MGKKANTADTLIIIPAYNEENNIGAVLEELVSKSLNADIVVINDGSLDHTEEVIRQYPVYFISHPCNLGYGAALQSGYKFAHKKGYLYVVQFDADGQHATEDLIRLIEEMRRGTDDVVIGSRFLGNPGFNPGLMKRIAITVFNTLIYGLTKTKVTDPTSGLRGLSNKVFGYYAVRNRFPSDFPDADIIIHMLLHSFRVREFPIGARERTQGVSMHSGIKPAIYFLKVLLSILAVLVQARIVHRGKKA
jgi:glycosyltransferase involved in cell wall biosynthesis